MHEASLAMSVLDTIINQCNNEGYGVIESVHLQIGAASGILPDSIKFAFDIAKNGTIAQNARMDIDIIPLGGSCLACNETFTVKDKIVFSCPKCNSGTIKITQGHEMHILDMEVN